MFGTPATAQLDEEARRRDEKRKQEDEQLRKKAEQEALEEERRGKEERKKRDEEVRRRKTEELKWEELGPSVVEQLAKPPPSVVDEKSVVGTAMSAWHLDEKTSQAAYTTNSLREGRLQGKNTVTLKELRSVGVGYWKVTLNDFTVVNQMCKERNYKQLDEIKLHQTAKDEGTLSKWYAEHFNDDEQIYLVIEGCMYIDVRSQEDTWVRMSLTVGDLVTIPPGAYHRVTLTEEDYVWIMRLLKDSSRWVPVNRMERAAENHPTRVKYLSALKRGVIATEAGLL